MRNRRQYEVGQWIVIEIDAAYCGHRRGWLINKNSGNRYVFSTRNGEVSYMREYRPPTNIPKYVTDFVKELEVEAFKRLHKGET